MTKITSAASGPRSLAAVVCAWLICISGDAYSAIYKCPTPDGGTRYSDKACTSLTQQKDSGRPSRPDRPEAAAEPVVQASPDASAVLQSSEPSLADAPAPIDPMERAGSQDNASAGPEQGSNAEVKAPPMSRAPRSGNWAIVWLGFIAVCVASVIHIVVAFRAGLTVWGITLILLAPLSNLLFTALHWRKARLGFLLAVAGTVACVGAYVPAQDLIEVADSFTTVRGNYDRDDRLERNAFALSDTVNLKTVVDWQDWSVQGIHQITWVWYANGEEFPFQVPVEFDDDTHVLLGYIPAETLGAGEHRVELYFDARLLDERSFSVAP